MKPDEEILELEQNLLKLENLHASFDYLRISLASPEKIRSWSEKELPSGEIVGEVLRGETINFRTHEPEEYGLFCEKIFGPTKDWKCRCGQYNGVIVNKICELCDVEIIESRVRRYRMGHIELSCPVTHIWYLKGIPNYIHLLLTGLHAYDSLTIGKTMEKRYLAKSEETGKYEEKVKKFKGEDVINLVYLNNLDENEKLAFFTYFANPRVDQLDEREFYIFSRNSREFKRWGSEIVKAALESLDLPKLIKLSRNFLDIQTKKHVHKIYLPESQKFVIRRLRILESFLATRTNPSWMILTILPVLPPSLRPLLELENGKLIAADVNEFYRLILNRNQRLEDFIQLYIAPDILTVQGRRLLQEGVDSLIDNARLPKNKQVIINNKALKSLTEVLEGKQGRFRQSLLGKRVDFSGRSVIIVGPTLRLNQCGLPYDMALELFQPFLVHELLKTKIHPPSHNTKLAYLILKKNKPFVWSLLISLSLRYTILLNRAPTLHRFGIQAFDPLLVLGQAIHLHPLVCTGFNADFDGDQMAVHLPLYNCTQLEAKTMMRPSSNVLSPSNGEVILKPTQDMVIGSYYLTLMIAKNKFENQYWFPNEEQAFSAFSQKKITIHTPIFVRYSLSDFHISMDLESKKISFLDKGTKFLDNKVDIEIYKIFHLGKEENKFYAITNIGLFIAYKVQEKKYEFTDLFLETTAGRLIFSMNLKYLMEK